DLALPLLRPGKSLGVALLPEGQDPDDLIRGGGRDAMEEVLSAALPLVDLLWLRETEGGGFETPERRAALEARLGAVIAAIGDESVRKHYRHHIGERLRGLFAPAEAAAAGAWSARRAAPAGRGFSRGQPARPGRPGGLTPREVLRPLSPRLGQ